ncbi:MAG: hypothetical protein ABIO32_15355 [Ferruginibacter sp.]
MAKKVVFCIILISFASYVNAQKPNSTYKLPKELVNFFEGRWLGEGEFWNGKKIYADITFSITLDSSWLLYEHKDKAPNKYKSMSMWGVDVVSGVFVAYNFDNFQGHRKFLSDGWKENKLILISSELCLQRRTVFEHFIYEKLTEKKFRMTYETSPDRKHWKLGDYLVFNKQ